MVRPSRKNQVAILAEDEREYATAGRGLQENSGRYLSREIASETFSGGGSRGRSPIRSRLLSTRGVRGHAGGRRWPGLGPCRRGDRFFPGSSASLRGRRE